MSSTVKTSKLKTYKKLRAYGLAKKQAAHAVGLPVDEAELTLNQDASVYFAKLLQISVPAAKLAKRIAEGIDAKETKFFQHEGKVTDKRDVVSWSERRAYAELAARWAGYVKDDAGANLVMLGGKVGLASQPAIEVESSSLQELESSPSPEFDPSI